MCENVKRRGILIQVSLYERVKFGVNNEVRDKTEGSEASKWVCVEYKWVQIWMMGCVDGGRKGKVNGDGS